jgi:hypothetical protein
VSPPTDQRGVIRPQGPGCDIGAFELELRLTLSSALGSAVKLEYVFQPGQTNQI